MNRRRVLGLLAGSWAAGWPWPARAFGEANRVSVTELDLGAGCVSRPDGWRRLLVDLAQATAVESRPLVSQVAPDDPALFEAPFCVLQAQDRFPLPDERGLEALGRYLAYGGFLVLDDVTGSSGGPAERALRDLALALFPTRPLSVLPADHSIYRSFFLLERGVGRIDRHPLEAVTSGSVSPLVLCRNDLSGALDRLPDGRPRSACVPGGEAQRREATKLAINLVLYALTADYKKDQAHVRQLMREGRLE